MKEHSDSIGRILYVDAVVQLDVTESEADIA
jgi:hypothetical protein